MLSAEAESRLSGLIKRIFKDDVVLQWDVAKDATDDLKRILCYCPRVDIAVGPFNVDGNVEQNQTRIEEAFLSRKNSFFSAFERHYDNLEYNKNPRCLLAIEVENKTTAKHQLGSILNAGALGRLGIVVGLNEKVYNSMIRIRNYLTFLKGVEKIEYEPTNVIILRFPEFESYLKR